ncbi:DNA phosphorothioation-associated putative methyltransferase [Mycobacteroides abscessus subsp. abscessus]|uniref:DNA phosphorothioation-associated putative methyltransferase n=1 Tax=Mycobacteroides abscessus TaxID=36809 RepID=UPI0019D2C3F4|nr:DNA phosphorothioation-associated putative methyltransferase [Mycobacteroides abscessus]MBN7305452.1 DNA phosphorothioation-associated putative methyltransferase [Mycobacteroides abscessus subsp. abscessus]QSM80023.1 DNA phosphorothioation-associated putative methyltransferase [Mycobacteroides abscessus subsp. abscessus]QSM85026.1 DNA phosphorothioation-associated putative methyltransferase [Mycobacteroides abscessus subsp. abscessus]
MTEQVARHRTAMTRAALSRPVALAISDGVLNSSLSVFDYGCGRGDDLRNLTALGFQTDGWDPSHRPEAALRPADIVNIGYVVNVIDDRAERRETLQRAWNLAKQVLVVSARLVWEARDLEGRPYADGLVTRTGTFQKFYEQAELAAWIEESLGVKPVAAAPGIFYVFRDAARAHEFLATRAYTYRPRMRADPHAVYETHKQTLAPLLDFLSMHARSPRSGELEESAEVQIRDQFSSIASATNLIRQVTDDDYWDDVRLQRRQEMLVYIAMSRFGRRPRFSELAKTLAADIKTHLGKYSDACLQADRLLLATGDPAIVLVSARSSSVGKQTPSALYVHRSALGHLPPVLRVYEACGRVLAGTVEHANMVKLSVKEPQVSYLTYPDFDRDPHPTLRSAVTVNLRRLSVDWRDYSRSENPPLLHRKEEFVGPDHPKRSLYERLTRAEANAGLYAHPERIGTLIGWQSTMHAAGVSVRGHRLVLRQALSGTDAK